MVQISDLIKNVKERMDNELSQINLELFEELLEKTNSYKRIHDMIEYATQQDNEQVLITFNISILLEKFREQGLIINKITLKKMFNMWVDKQNETMFKPIKFNVEFNPMSGEDSIMIWVPLN